MTRIEELALVLFAELRDGSLTQSDLELIEARLQQAFDDGAAAQAEHQA